MTVKKARKGKTYVKQRWTSQTSSPNLFLMGLSYDSRPLQVPWCFAFGLLLFGFALEGEGLLQLFGNVEGVEVSSLPHNRLWGFKDRVEDEENNSKQ